MRNQNVKHCFFAVFIALSVLLFETYPTLLDIFIYTPIGWVLCPATLYLLHFFIFVELDDKDIFVK